MGKDHDAINKMKASVKGLTGQSKPAKDSLFRSTAREREQRKEEKLAEKFNLRAQIPVSQEQEEVINRVARTLKKRMVGAPFVMNKGAVVRGLIDLLAKVEQRVSEFPAPRDEEDLVEVLKRSIKG
jgi:hypothetical protein